MYGIHRFCCKNFLISVTWIFLAVTMVKLLIRLQKINKLITRGINERRRKP